MVGNARCTRIAYLLSLLFTSFSVAVSQPKITLRVLDEAGVRLKQVAVGKPFFLEVSVENMRTNAQPTIKGLDRFHVEKQSMRMTMVNGVSSIKHRYAVVIDKPGTYRIGPAEIDHDDEVLASITVAIIAGDEEKQDPRFVARTKKDETKKVLLHVASDKERVVVGESLRCYVRFMVAVNDIGLQQIQVPDFSGFEIVAKSGPKSGKETVQGVQYEYVEWEWTLLAKQVGNKKIPSFHAEYVQQHDGDDDLFGGFQRMFRGMLERKRIHSQPLVIRVDPLPETDKDVVAVGSFSQLHASVERAVVREGDGVVFALELEGDGNFAMINEIALCNIPAGFKPYPSTTTMIDNSGVRKKRFEYVLQALERGAWEIPAQPFYYYDVQEHVYKELYSNPVSINILAAAHNAQKVSTSVTPKEPAVDVLETQDQAGTVLALCEEFNVCMHKTWVVPWKLFWLLLLMPTLLIILMRYRSVLYARLLGRLPGLQKKIFWRQLRKRADRAQKDGDAVAMYELFSEIVIHYTHAPMPYVTADTIASHMHAFGLSNHEQHDLCEVLEQLQAMRFAGSFGEHEQVFKQARGWIERLYELLKEVTS